MRRNQVVSTPTGDSLHYKETDEANTPSVVSNRDIEGLRAIPGAETSDMKPLTSVSRNPNLADSISENRKSRISGLFEALFGCRRKVDRDVLDQPSLGEQEVVTHGSNRTSDTTEDPSTENIEQVVDLSKEIPPPKEVPTRKHLSTRKIADSVLCRRSSSNFSENSSVRSDEKKVVGKFVEKQNKRFRDVPLCSVCNHSASVYIFALDRYFHPDCFRCVACNETIKPNAKYTTTTLLDRSTHGTGELERSELFPIHKECFDELYEMTCTICQERIPSNPDGSISYTKHSFFANEIMCPEHVPVTRRCGGCSRYEPLIGCEFADVGDANRCLCPSCCRTVIVDNMDAKPLWNKVLNFFQDKLELPVWDGMRGVPVLIVGSETLNDSAKSQASAHGGSSQIMTRGLCLVEHLCRSRTSYMSDRKYSSVFSSLNLDAGRDLDGVTYLTSPPDLSRGNSSSFVTAILCLSGLPSDLTASILAHEATHAWIKLHPEYDCEKPIPLAVEEGICQLVAYLFLNDGLDLPSNIPSDDGGPTEEKLRQYFRFNIETDSSEVYGLGFRKASEAYAEIGIEALLSHVVLYRDLPHV